MPCAVELTIYLVKMPAVAEEDDDGDGEGAAAEEEEDEGPISSESEPQDPIPIGLFEYLTLQFCIQCVASAPSRLFGGQQECRRNANIYVGTGPKRNPRSSGLTGQKPEVLTVEMNVA